MLYVPLPVDCSRGKAVVAGSIAFARLRESAGAGIAHVFVAGR